MSEPDLEANKAIVRQFYDAVQAHDLETVAKLYVEDYTSGEYLGLDGEWHEHGLEEEIAKRAEFLDAFPDLAYELPLVVAEGKHVVVEKILTATHRGEYMGIPPTGREINTGGHATFRIEEGRIAEINGTTNYLRALVQLGVLELPLVSE